MTQHKWNTWFILSTIWVLLHVMLVMMDDTKQIMTHWFFLFGMILSMVNLAFCIYVGTQPSED